MAIFVLIERNTGKHIAAYGEVDPSRFEVGRLHREKRRRYQVTELIPPSRSTPTPTFRVVVEQLQ